MAISHFCNKLVNKHVWKGTSWVFFAIFKRFMKFHCLFELLGEIFIFCIRNHTYCLYPHTSKVHSWNVRFVFKRKQWTDGSLTCWTHSCPQISYFTLQQEEASRPSESEQVHLICPNQIQVPAPSLLSETFPLVPFSMHRKREMEKLRSKLKERHLRRQPAGSSDDSGIIEPWGCSLL